MENPSQYIKPELLVLVPVLCALGAMLKHSGRFPANHIPLALAGAGVLLAGLWVLGTAPALTPAGAATAAFTALCQGILCAAAAVYAHQLYKQEKGGQ